MLGLRRKVPSEVWAALNELKDDLEKEKGLRERTNAGLKQSQLLTDQRHKDFRGQTQSALDALRDRVNLVEEIQERDAREAAEKAAEGRTEGTKTKKATKKAATKVQPDEKA